LTDAETTGPPGTEPVAPPPGGASGAAAGRRRRPRLSHTTKRVLLIVAGLLIAAGSVTGFYLVAEELDERVPVMVAAVDIQAGDTIAAEHLTYTLASLDSIPHIPWSPGASAALDGRIAAHPVSAGSLVDMSMTLAPGAIPLGGELTLLVPLDTGLAPEGVFDGDRVLLIDPGAEPTGAEGEDGRPQRVLREFEVANFDGSQMRLFLAPGEWGRWRSELEAAGGVFHVLPVPLGGDGAELAAQLDALWGAQWAEAVAEAAAAREDVLPPEAGPGELEVVVPLNEALAPSGIADGDFVLLIDPGSDPVPDDPGRPRSVLRSLEITNYEGGRIRLFVSPEQWIWWSSLPETLGQPPLVLPVAPGTDLDDTIRRLNLEWLFGWEAELLDLDRRQAEQAPS